MFRLLNHAEFGEQLINFSRGIEIAVKSALIIGFQASARIVVGIWDSLWFLLEEPRLYRRIEPGLSEEVPYSKEPSFGLMRAPPGRLL